jgi:hypothetical protein
VELRLNGPDGTADSVISYAVGDFLQSGGSKAAQWAAFFFPVELDLKI